MWLFYTLAVIQLLSVSTVRGNGGGWESPNQANQPTQQEYWWKNPSPFQKPANHPGIEQTVDNSGGGQGWGAPAPAPSRPVQNNYQPQKPVQSYNPPQPTSIKVQSYNPPQQQSQPAVPIQSYNPPTQSYQNYQSPSAPIVNPNCMLTSKKDCHGGQTSYPQDSSSSYSQPQLPVQQVQIPVSSGGSYGGGSLTETVYSPQPIKQINQPIPQSPKPNNPPAASNYNSYGISVPTSPVQPQPVKTSYNPGPQQVSYQKPSVPSIKPQNNHVGYQQQYQQPPTQQQHSYQSPSNNYSEQPPYPGCPAALLCVPDDRCNAEGKIEETSVVLSAAEKVYRVALMACSSPKTGVVGVCCRDPNYKDPWPDMNGGQQQQHHHHHGDKGGGNNGQYNSQPQQPTNNFNSYSGGGTGGGCQCSK